MRHTIILLEPLGNWETLWNVATASSFLFPPFPISSLLSLLPHPNCSLFHTCHFSLPRVFLPIHCCLSSVVPSLPGPFVHCFPYLPSFRISSAPSILPANATALSATSLTILSTPATWNTSAPSQLCTFSPPPMTPLPWQLVPIWALTCLHRPSATFWPPAALLAHHQLYLCPSTW